MSNVFEQALQDLRFGARIITQSPVFAASAAALVALGIGGNTAIFSMVNAIVTKPMPGVQAKNLVSLGVLTKGQEDDPGNSYPNYLDYAAESKTLSRILARGYERFTLALEKESYGFSGGLITPNYFDTLGVRLAKGRPFTAQEGGPHAEELAAIISHRVWQEQFGGSEQILGRSILLNGHVATIVGVAPPRFRGAQVGEHQDIWVPILSYSRVHGNAKRLTERANFFIEMVGQLAPGATLSRARAEFEGISKRLEAAYPAENRGKAAILYPYSALGPMPGTRPVVLFQRIILAVAFVTLLIVCANVANLMLTRAVFRQREMAIRQSIGASRGRVFRMLLAEGMVVSLFALAAAWLFTIWTSNALQRFIPPERGMAIDLDFAQDWRVAAYAVILAALSTLAFTVAPAVRAWRQEVLPWLKAGEQTVAQGRSKLSSVLVITQLALCVLLLTSAGLAYRSKSLVDTLDLHIGNDHLLLVTVNTQGSAASREQNATLLDRLRDRMRGIPGVVAASYATIEPLRGSLPLGPVASAASAKPVAVDGNSVGPDYLRTLGVVLLEGRDLSEADRTGAKRTVVINQNLADTLWPGQPALGQTMLLGDAKQVVEVAGVVPNGVYSGLRQGTRRNFVFLPERQNPAAPGEMTFHVRYTGRLDAVASAVRAAVRETDVHLPIFYMRTMETHLQEILGPTLLVTVLLSLFAGGALILAGVGLYAVIAFNMSRRTRDFGIRMAMGASSGQILEMVLKEGLTMTVIGLVVGFALSLACGKALGSMLFGVTPTDKLTYGGVFGLLAIVSLIACYLPARRAARIDPILALRQE